jgi:hypothetical protein
MSSSKDIEKPSNSIRGTSLFSYMIKFLLTCNRWEKAHYYLGKHYNKILDSEKAKPLGKEAQI